MKTDRSGDLARLIARFVTAPPPLEGVALERAKIVVCDTLAATVAGVSSEVLPALTAYFAVEPAATGDKPVLGTALRTTGEQAALINASMAAALEFDDVLSLMPGHPSAVVLGALLATDCGLNASGHDLVEAYAVGVEGGVRIAQAMTLDHYRKGYHATGTLCMFSAACGLARLYRLPEDQTCTLIGLVASMAGGLQANFGFMAKPLHSGLAARAALSAFHMVRAGVTANAQVFESEGGFFAAYGSENSHADQVPQAPGQPWAFESPGITLKLYPCCYASHRAMDGLQSMMQELGVDGAGIARIDCETPPGGLIPLKYPRPQTHLESLFSLPYALAVTALDGMPGLESFQEQRVRSADVADMLTRIHVAEGLTCVKDYPDYEKFSFGSRAEVHVALTTVDGRRLERKIRFAPGHPARPVEWPQALAKLGGCLRSVGMGDRFTPQLQAQVASIERLPSVRPLVDALCKS